ncbi:MAG: adenosylcobinamide-GDP ribazoletransferase [Nitrosomonadales bacterium]|nr:adenosylcobinamide-GDP ribazoletransferase [Nitrosomonadales bacterium]
MKPFYPLLLAIQFLTQIPVMLKQPYGEREIGASLLYYPLVGLLLGALLAGLHTMLHGVPVLLHAALLLAAWVAMTGALHLDGLADSADAWLGGIGNRERTLAIMKDPYAGPAAVVAVVLVLLLKFSALVGLTQCGNDWALLWPLLLARSAMPLLFITTPYVRPGGLGDAFARHAPRRAVIVMLLATLLAVLVVLGMRGAWLVLGCIAVFWLLRRMMMARLGGTTGDTAGALLELLETAALILWVLMDAQTCS